MRAAGIGAARRARLANKQKTKEAVGEKSEIAKTDRLRISAFQGFWKGVNENILMLRAISPREKASEGVELTKEEA